MNDEAPKPPAHDHGCCGDGAPAPAANTLSRRLLLAGIASTVLALLVGTPALTAFGTIGAAVTVSLKRGGLLAPVLILPLCIPVLIFGVAAIGAPEGSSAAFLFLSAISLVSVAFCPFAAALALRVSGE